MSEAGGALIGLFTTVVTALLGAVAWLYRENRKDRATEATALQAECAEWKALALAGLGKAQRAADVATQVVAVVKENGV
jgi:hypothetical protein